MTSLTQNRHRPFGPQAEQFSDLLRSYPRLDPNEIEEMIAIYPKLTILEKGLLSSDEDIGARLDAFTREHRVRLKESWRHHLLFIIVMLATFGMLAAIAWTVMN